LWVEVGIVAAPVVTALSAVLYQLSMPPMDYRTNKEPYARGNYDPVAARAYYSKQPKLVAQRCLQLLRLGNKFLINFLLDKYVWKREERMRVVRADELLQLITNLGPTAIKIGQALSVRPDLIPTEYASALATLQDQVPPFDGLAAKEILLRELGPTVYAQLKGMGLETTNKLPIASASIGQVYKASLADGREVAVKVQRPNVLAEIALDLHIVREFAPIYQKLTSTNSDLQALANEWGRGFIAELDYIKEANNTIRFNQGMQRRNMNAVCAPTVLLGYSTEQILTTEWVEGTRIDRSNAEDIPRLCSVALNAYLVMLLDSDFSLHCDPHPGNLLRTTDGRLCILDHGMTLDIDPNLQYSLLDFVAHLTSNNYDALPEDLVALNFLNPDKLDFIRRSGALEPFKYVLKQAGQGGGAKGVRDRIFQDYREKYGLDATEDELRVEMRKEMKVRKSLACVFSVRYYAVSYLGTLILATNG
jgi:predicted unusual protein kinase regulating ubiquinone biosynthesis (AarF/ABC1/UbiB family)